MASSFSAEQLIYSSPPNLLEGPCQTISDSVHDLEVKARLVHWKTFGEEVRAVSKTVNWADFPSALLYYASTQEQQSGRIPSEPEVWCCGDEASVSGRFSQNIAHVTGQVFCALGIPAWFGDSRACKGANSKTIPDIVMIGKDAVEQVVGEVKTPWMHDLASIMWKGGSEFRNCLGQLANYMRVHNVKYGFITTYHQTIFCKQDSLPKGTQRKRPGKAPEFALWYSDEIRHDSTKPIFLRECFLFLGIQIGHGNCKFQNPMSAEKWSSDGKGVFDDDDYISPDDTPEYAEQRQQRRGPRGVTERLTRSQAQNAVAVEFGGRQPPQGSQLRAGGNQRGGQATESQRHGYILEGERNRYGFHIVYRHREGYFFELRDNVPHPVTIDLRQNSSIGEWYYEIDGCRYYVDVRQLE